MSTLDAPLAPPPLPDAFGAGRWSRWSDRLNPILVREVQQAVKGRMFAVAMMVALVVTVVIAIQVASNYQPGGDAGQGAFEAGLATLVPLALFVVPMQAYQSMRLELRGGIVEQLLLSRLRPASILFGKLQAAMVQFVLYVAVVSPTLATSYLLRGVDLPTIAVSIAAAALACGLATMMAISSAAQSRHAATQALANLGTAFGLGIGTFSMVGLVLSGEYTDGMAELLRSGIFGRVAAAVLLTTGYASLLLALAARAFLLHAFENKATPFRIALFAAPVLAYGWCWFSFGGAGVPGGAMFAGGGARAESMLVMSFFLLLLGIGFGLFMVTEQRDLSPRVRAHVPRRGLLALLATPLLPGRDRGMACFLLYMLVPTVVGAIAWSQSAIASRGWWDRFASMFAFTACYGCIYLAIGRTLRHRLPATLGGNHAGRILLPMTLVAFMLLPVLVDVFLHGHPTEWHWGHAMNPFWTIFHFQSERSGALPALPGPFVLLVAVMTLLQVPAIGHGLFEVLAAAAARRNRVPASPRSSA